MNFYALLVGLFLVAVGVGAIAGGDYWDGWEWILSGGAVVLGGGGLISALWRRDDQTRR